MLSSSMVEEFLTRLDMALSYMDYKKMVEDNRNLTEALLNEIQINQSLATALSSKNKNA